MLGLYFRKHSIHFCQIAKLCKVAIAACDRGDHVEQPKDREACGLQASLTWLAFCWRCKTFSFCTFLQERFRAWMVWTASTGRFKNTLNNMLSWLCDIYTTLYTYHIPIIVAKKSNTLNTCHLSILIRLLRPVLFRGCT